MTLEAPYKDTKITLVDVCNNPLSRPDRTNNICNIQSVWSYWQDSIENLDHIKFWEFANRNLTYFDHLLKCAKNPTSTSKMTKDDLTCLSSGGLPMQPFVVLGGFIPEDVDGFPEKPEYEKSTAVVMTFLLDNYDGKSTEQADIEGLEKAMAWELAYVALMKEWTSKEENIKHMDVAFFSER
jgi:hypothetical protein